MLPSIFTLQTDLRSQIIPLALNSSLMQTGADMLPLRMSAKSTVTDSCELRKDECHTHDRSQLQYIHPIAGAN